MLQMYTNKHMLRIQIVVIFHSECQVYQSLSKQELELHFKFLM